MKLRLIAILLVGAALAGCATKHYGRQGTVTPYESTEMSCKEINLELAKIDGFKDQIEKESQFSGRSVLSFLGDFGIGNVMEKNAALKSADERRATLVSLRASKNCDQQTPAQP